MSRLSDYSEYSEILRTSLIHFLNPNQSFSESGPFLTSSKFQVVNEKHILKCILKKKKA